jgi:hypothetical protein
LYIVEGRDSPEIKEETNVIETTDFALKNENVENWTATQFWEADPVQNNQSLQRICLYVDWESKEVEVETVMNTNSTPGRIWHGLASRYNLPEDSDFSRFKEFYDEEIKPILIKASEGFESNWNGSNWKGEFTEEAQEELWNIEQTLRGTPKHDYYYYFDVLGAFEGKQHLAEYLENDGIDFLKADLENEETLSKIIESIESGDVVMLNMGSNDYKKELSWIQEELREEE